MHAEVGPWISLYNLCKSELFQGQSLQLLDRAGATPEDYDIFISLDSIVNQTREARMQARKG